MTRVLIKLSTLKKNPDVGRTDYQELMGTDVTITLSNQTELPKPFSKKPYLVIARTGSETSPGVVTFTYTLKYLGHVTQELQQHWVDLIGKNLGVSIDYRYQDIHSLYLELDYLFEYYDLPVKCKHCRRLSLRSEIYDDYGDYDVHIADICPKCRKSECVDLEFETVEEALKRKRL